MAKKRLSKNPDFLPLFERTVLASKFK
jgi:hypothetical protein